MRRLVVVVAAFALSACSQAVTPQTPQGGGIGSSAPPSGDGLAEPSVPIYVIGGSPKAGPEIIGYGVSGHTKPVILSAGGLINPVEIAIDGGGVIYVGDTGTKSHRSSSVAEFTVGHKGPLRTIKSPASSKRCRKLRVPLALAHGLDVIVGSRGLEGQLLQQRDLVRVELRPVPVRAI
jgi:hypothetical protein